MERKECLEMQLSEIEMLYSMYPKKEEFSITDPSVIPRVKNFIEGRTTNLLNNLDYSLYLDIPPGNKEPLELKVIYPHEYPNIPPNVYARSSSLCRNIQKELNDAIIKYLSTDCQGELCMLQLISWMQEKSEFYFNNSLSECINSFDLVLNTKLTSQQSNSDTFSRCWIYSHHIYNKDKRRTILQNAKDYSLTGFCLPGKPGIICIEGYTKDCDDFYQMLRQMTWKKISLVKKDCYEIKNDLDLLKHFEGFNEISFQVRRGPAKEYHMNMGEFYKYLDEHKLADVFQIIFGVEGHTTDPKS